MLASPKFVRVLLFFSFALHHDFRCPTVARHCLALSNETAFRCHCRSGRRAAMSESFSFFRAESKCYFYFRSQVQQTEDTRLRTIRLRPAGRSRNWPKSKLIGRSRTNGVCSVSSFSLSFFFYCFVFTFIYFFLVLTHLSLFILFLFCFCFRPQKPELNPKPRTLHPISDGPFRWTLPPVNAPPPDNPPRNRTTLRRTTLRRTTLRRTTLRRTTQNFALFFPPPATIFILLSLSWSPLWNFVGFF